MKKNLIPYGSVISFGTYICADCGHQYYNESKTSIPPCPNHEEEGHEKRCWIALSGWDRDEEN